MDVPVRELQVSIDQDTWPGTGILDIVLQVDTLFLGAAQILLAPYVEGRTWTAESGLDERPYRDFYGASKPRVDARFRWAGRVLTATAVLDATDLRNQPLRLPFSLPGDEYTGQERARTMVLLERYELPFLRKLIDQGSTV